MRAAERRWRRTLQGIVLGSLAACHAPEAVDGGPADSAEEDDGACAPIPSDMIDDAAGDCASFVTLPCGLREDASVSLCYPDLGSCAAACPNDILYCVLVPASCAADGGALPGPALVECSGCGSGGRRPRGMRAPRSAATSELGDHFARLAHLEGASVRAFEDLSRALASLGAPQRLVSAARRAANDERRHARAMGRLARRFGANVPPVRVPETRAPTLATLLEENAIEGCANETWGALVATWQTRRARDARVRSSMRAIARDETRHAALAWEVHAWGLPRVDAADRARVQRRLNEALRSLGRSGALAARSANAIGQPDASVTRRLAENLRRAVGALAV